MDSFKTSGAILNFSIEQLNLVISALYNACENKKFVTNVRKLYNSWNEESYMSDEEKKIRVYTTRVVCDIIIEKNIINKEDINKLIQFNGQYGQAAIDLLEILGNTILSEQYIYSVDKMISNKLKSVLIEEHGTRLVKMYNTFISSTYPDSQFDIVLNEVERETDSLSKAFKTVRETMDEQRHTISTFDGSFMNSLDKLIAYENTPSSKLKTGIKLFNNMLNGGFEQGRVYCALGVAKGWKSGFLLNSAIWIKKYNKMIKPKDPTKRPVVLYLTLENTETETLRRAITYAYGNNVDFKNMPRETMYNGLKKSGFIAENEEDPNEIGIIIKYAPNKTLTVQDISVMLDDLQKDGLECICCIIDYLKRIKPMTKNKELRIELGDITDDLCTMAKEKQIPIITAMQLNRVAIKELNDTPHPNIQHAIEASRGIGSSNISESVDVIQNVDCAFTVSLHNENTTDDSTGITTTDKYLILREVAVRFNTLCNATMFIHRFEKNNGMRLLEDIGLPENQMYSIDTSVAKQEPGSRIVTTTNRW